MDKYQTVFDFTGQYLLGLTFGGDVLVLVLTVGLFVWTRRSARSLSVLAIAAPILAFFAYSTIVALREYREIRNQIDSGRLVTIEGPVVDVFWHCNHTVQTFVVSGIRFGSTTCLPSPGFSPGSLFQPTVKSGEHVRVTYFDASWGERVITMFERREN